MTDDAMECQDFWSARPTQLPPVAPSRKVSRSLTMIPLLRQALVSDPVLGHL